MNRRFKKGAASFYIVAFSTLILVILAASFATVIISEVTRASNDDLSQSAYDSALAGVEEAKLAYSNYRRCISKNSSLLTSPPTAMTDGDNLTCQDIVYLMNNPDAAGCDMVALMVGALSKREWRNGDRHEIMISETTDGANAVSMNQAYTCVTMNRILDDYRANLTSDNNVRVVRVEFAGNVKAEDIGAIKLSWYMLQSDRGETANFADFTNNRVTFRSVGEIRPSVPPTLSLQMVQTAESFTLGSYNSAGLNGIAQGTTTDRATLFLVPTNDGGKAGSNVGKTGSDLMNVDNAYIGTYSGGQNQISATQVAKTNNQYISDLPYVVYCGDGSADFMCSVTVNLPEPVAENGTSTRNNDTFMFLVTLPYSSPNTEFAMSFICKSTSTNCNNASAEAIYEEGGKKMVRILGTQVLIDSTGRANDLYRRIETRLETTDISFPYTYYAMQILGSSGGELKKNMEVKCENNFYDSGTNVRWYNGGGSSGSFGALSGSSHCSS